jgi:hypothetical protein
VPTEDDSIVENLSMHDAIEPKVRLIRLNALKRKQLIFNHLRNLIKGCPVRPRPFALRLPHLPPCFPNRDRASPHSERSPNVVTSCDSCSSSRGFASSFLPTSPRNETVALACQFPLSGLKRTTAYSPPMVRWRGNARWFLPQELHPLVRQGSS